MDVDLKLRLAARAISRAGLAHAYGHCSVRLDAETLRVCPSMPMGMIPAGAKGQDAPVRGPLPDGVLGEVRLHQKIYERRAEVGGVVRFMGPSVMALGALGRAPRMRHGFGSYFHPGVGFWNETNLARDDALAEAAIDCMTEGPGLLMRGNGAVVCAPTLERAVVLAWYLEDACRIELAALATGLADTGPVFSLQAARERATDKGGIFERMWDHLTFTDPERLS